MVQIVKTIRPISPHFLVIQIEGRPLSLQPPRSTDPMWDTSCSFQELVQLRAAQMDGVCRFLLLAHSTARQVSLTSLAWPQLL